MSDDAHTQSSEHDLWLSRLLGEAVHELRTPLTSLKIDAARMQRALSQAEPSRERLSQMAQGVMNQTQRLSDLASLLESVGLLKKGELKPPSAALDLAERCRMVVDRHKDEAKGGGSALSFVGPGSLPAEGHAELLSALLTCMLRDALRRGHGEPIVVELRQAEGGAEVRVTAAGEPQLDRFNLWMVGLLSPALHATLSAEGGVALLTIRC